MHRVFDVNAKMPITAPRMHHCHHLAFDWITSSSWPCQKLFESQQNTQKHNYLVSDSNLSFVSHKPLECIISSMSDFHHYHYHRQHLLRSINFNSTNIIYKNSEKPKTQNLVRTQKCNYYNINFIIKYVRNLRRPESWSRRCNAAQKCSIKY